MIYKRLSALIILSLFIVAGYSQNSINSYKYVLLPQKFDFLSSDDEYDLNTIAKSLLEQKGFTVFWSNGNMPQAIATNKCTALMAEVTQRKALFTTNLTLTLKDCYGNVIFKGKEGKSREKEFGPAYEEALKNAFASLSAVPYKYDSSLSAQPQQVAAAPAGAPPAPVSPKHTISDASGTLYAQAIPNGYQLIDTTPKKVMTLLKTSKQDCFLVDTGDGSPNAVVFKENGDWFFEYYKDGALISQKLTIKF